MSAGLWVYPWLNSVVQTKAIIHTAQGYDSYNVNFRLKLIKATRVNS